MPRPLPSKHGSSRLVEIRRAVRDLRSLRQEIGKRKGFKPLSNKEIKDAVNQGRR